jgi:hypothetical protein
MSFGLVMSAATTGNLPGSLGQLAQLGGTNARLGRGEPPQSPLRLQGPGRYPNSPRLSRLFFCSTSLSKRIADDHRYRQHFYPVDVLPPARRLRFLAQAAQSGGTREWSAGHGRISERIFCSMSSQPFLNLRTSIGHELPADCHRGRKGGTKAGLSAGKATYSPARGLALTPCHLFERGFPPQISAQNGKYRVERLGWCCSLRSLSRLCQGDG